MLELIGWCGSIFAVIGACLNARGLRVGFLFYIISNIVLMTVGWYKGEVYNVYLFMSFLIIAGYGYMQWGKKIKEYCGGLG